MYTLEDSIKKYIPAIKLTTIISRDTLSIIRKISFLGSAIFGTSALVTFFYLDGQYSKEFLGAALLFGAVWLEQMLIFSFHNSYYFHGLNSTIGLDEEVTSGATYDLAETVFRYPNDVTLAFCSSRLGSITLIRSGLTLDSVEEFLKSNRPKMTTRSIFLPDDEIFSLIGLGKYLLVHDVNFNQMIRTAGISNEIFISSLRWVIGSYHQEKRRSRWWSKDNLSQTTGIGREWTYGTAYLLDKFSKNIHTSSVFSTFVLDSSFGEEKVTEIESALARTQSSNVLIIGEAGVGKIDLVIEVSRRMKLGKSLDSIAGKQIIVLDTTRLFAVAKDKQTFEITVINMLDEATLAGNIVIVIENISTFIREAESIGVFIPELLDQYLALPQIQIIATDTPGAYHTYLETLGSFTRRFSEILISSSDLSATTRLLQNIALENEFRYKIFFTYAGLNAITTSADRYIVGGVMPDKAISLLGDIATKAHETKTDIVSEDFVYKAVSEKTGVPAGPIEITERDLLLHLEDKLHQQVVGQQNAISAIARTMRRARVGIQSSEKPIGSFLFLGPTGVGKTETAKALAKIFFGSEDKMQRMDMSEYGGPDALKKLLGTNEEPGTLANLLREHPYSVFLLDELEKATQPVHDIFLQILDEGIFTDGRGMKINARNTIIIATSNAGSQLILRTVQQRKELSHLFQEIINNIVRDGVFRPEFINRFDSTIIFEPLTVGQQTEVAKLMVKDLYKRVEEKGYELEVSDELLEYLAEKSYHPEFGARPMRRILQNVIEEKVAQKIISGEVKKGGVLRLSLEDFTGEELNIE